ncbi:MAG TPA: DUF4097 family beta strand repeat-containing protein [Bacteroidota bacterium]|jgi:DUF4097 and DUF4098 domain-containing protein YvlB|nr:DUF4097 family beta strand repeat-containing protein [Bacteroidota bacterium]
MKYCQRFVFVVISILTFSFLLSADDEKGEKARTFTVSKGGMLDVSVNIGNIHVRTWDKNEVTVHLTTDDEEEGDYSGVRIRQRENTIHIDNDRRYDYEPWGEVDISVDIPSQFNIQLATAAGDIDITGKVAGDIEAQTSGGNINTGAVDGRVLLVTSGGDISTDDVNGDLSLNTSGGNIRVGIVTGITDVHTSGGDIIIDRSDKKVTAETAGGNVQIGDIGGDALVSTAGGDIMVERVSGNARLKSAGGNVSLRSANGAVVARTAGGDIHADSIVGSIDAKTSAGNIEVELIPSGSGKTKLSSSVGDVRLYISENAKASITARNRMHYAGSWDENEDAIASDFKEDSYENDTRRREVRASYTLNGGGQQISIETSMGRIEILKADSRKRQGWGTKHKVKYKR